MCGIVGMAGDVPLVGTDVKIFKEMMVFSTVRGFDSTGLVTAREEKQNQKENEAPLMYFRTTMNPVDALYYNRDVDKFIEPGRLRVLLGHNRAATRGKISQENCHPFNFNNVIGVHNGTIHRYFKGHHKYETDSEGLYALIDEVGIDEALSEVNGGGAYALVYFDKVEDTLNFIRNDERPLFWAINDARNTMLWASEPAFIIGAAYRNNMKLAEPGIQPFKEGVLTSLSWKEDKFLKNFKNRPIEIKKKVYSSVSTYNEGYTSGRGYSYKIWDYETNSFKTVYRNDQMEHERDFFEAAAEKLAQDKFKEQKMLKPPEKKEENKDCPVPQPKKNLTREEKKAKRREDAERRAQEKDFRENHAERVRSFHQRNNPGFVPGSEKEEQSTETKWYKGYNGVWHTNHEIDLILGGGCAACKTEFSLDNLPTYSNEVNDIVWTGTSEFVCDSCKDQDWVKDYLQQVQSQNVVR